jgi:hypothetical protein
MLTAFRIIKLPTRIKTEPVDHEGKLLRMGEKKMAMKNQKEVAIAVRPVLPPSEIPAADSERARKSEQAVRLAVHQKLTNEGSTR